MHYAGISSNIMSLAGIAIAIGVLVDAGIVVTENAFRFLEQRAIDPRTGGWCGRRWGLHAAGRPAGVLLDGDHPARLHSGVHAHRTGRQAVPSTGVHEDFAVLAATVVSVTLVPVLCTLLLGGKVHAKKTTP